MRFLRSNTWSRVSIVIVDKVHSEPYNVLNYGTHFLLNPEVQAIVWNLIIHICFYLLNVLNQRQREACSPLIDCWQMGEISQHSLWSAWRIMAWCVDTFHKDSLHVRWQPSHCRVPEVTAYYPSLYLCIYLTHAHSHACSHLKNNAQTTCL